MTPFLALKVIFTEYYHFSGGLVLSVFYFQNDLDLLLDSPSSLTVNVRLWLYFIQLYISYSKLNRFLYQHDPRFAKSTVRGTVKEKSGFTPGEDAAALRKAMEGVGKSLPWVWSGLLVNCTHPAEMLKSCCFLIAGCWPSVTMRNCVFAFVISQALLKRLLLTFWLKEAMPSASWSVKRIRTPLGRWNTILPVHVLNMLLKAGWFLKTYMFFILDS